MIDNFLHRGSIKPRYTRTADKSRIDAYLIWFKQQGCIEDRRWLKLINQINRDLKNACKEIRCPELTVKEFLVPIYHPLAN